MAVAFASATNRRFWQSTLLITILHIGIAIGVGFYLASSGGDPWLAAAFVYAGVIAVSIFWWASRQIVGWFVWKLLWRRAAINDLVANFQKASLPRPENLLASAEAYFEDVVKDGELHFEVRMAAGAHYLRVAEFAPQQGLITAMRTAGLYEEAISAYRNTFGSQPH
jgi:hypothetical protein